MFDPFTLALIGGAIGGLTNKKDPLKGAVLGAASGFGGGHLASGLLAPSSAAAANTGVTAAAGEGLKLAAPSGGSLGGGLGVKASSSALFPSATTNATTSATTGGLIPPASYGAAPASTPSLTSFTNSLKNFNSNVKPFGEAAGTAMAVKGLLAPEEQMVPPPAPLQVQPLDLSSVLTTNQQEMARTFEEDMKRRQSMGAFAQYAMGAR